MNQVINNSNYFNIFSTPTDLTKEIFSGGDIQYANRVSKLRFGSGI